MCYLTPTRRFGLSDLPIRGKWDVFLWLSDWGRKNPWRSVLRLLGRIDISDGTLEEKLASFVSHVPLMADLFQGAKN